MRVLVPIILDIVACLLHLESLAQTRDPEPGNGIQEEAKEKGIPGGMAERNLGIVAVQAATNQPRLARGQGSRGTPSRNKQLAGKPDVLRFILLVEDWE